MENIHQTFQNAERAFVKLLPNSTGDWRKILPLDNLVKARTINEFETFKSNWESFLEQLDKIWNRLNAFVKHHLENELIRSSLQGYLGQINKTRINDDLLVYLDKARNSAHHTLWRHIRESENGEIVTDANGVAINTDKNMLEITFQNCGAVSEIVVFESCVVLLSTVEIVEGREKRIIFLPEKHLGKVLYPIDRVLPHMIGKKGLQFYEKLILNVDNRINNFKSLL